MQIVISGQRNLITYISAYFTKLIRVQGLREVTPSIILKLASNKDEHISVLSTIYHKFPYFNEV